MSESISTVAELESRLRDLELHFLGPPCQLSNPFNPVSSQRSRIDRFKAISRSSPQTQTQSSPQEISEKREVKVPAVQLPVFDGLDLDTFLKDWERWLRLSGVQDLSDKTKLDWLVEACTPKVKKLVEKVIDEKNFDLLAVFTQLETLFPKLENDLTLRATLRKISQLPQNPEPSAVATLFLELEEIFVRLSAQAMSDQEKFLLLMEKVHPKTFQDLRQDRYYKHRTQDYQSLKSALIEKANEDWLERHLLQQKKQSLQPLVESQSTKPSSQPKPATTTTGSGPAAQDSPKRGKGMSQNSATNRQQGQGRGSQKGRGKGKGIAAGKDRTVSVSRFSRNTAPDSQNSSRFSATIICKWCNKKGHYEDFCWAKERWEKRQKGKGNSSNTPENSNTQSSDANPRKRKADALQILQMKSKTYALPVKVYGQQIQAILDTGATISAVAKKFVPDSQLRRSEAVPLQVGSGEFIYSFGNADLLLQFGPKVFQLSAVVVETNAFQAVLGTDFTESEHFGGLLTRPPRVLIDGQEFCLQDCPDTKPEIRRLFRLFKTESYSLTQSLRKDVLTSLDLSPNSISVDMFANHANFQESFYLTKSNSAFRYNWQKLLGGPEEFLWANPPFSQLSKVITKLCLEPTRLILVHPDWVDQYWSPLLREITISRVQIPSGTPVFVIDRKKNLFRHRCGIPKFRW